MCLATNVLIGMDYGIQYYPGGCYYAQVERPYVFEGQFIKKAAYPLVVKQLGDNKVVSQFNFNNPIKFMTWVDCTLCVVLHDGEKHAFSLNYLQRDLHKNKQSLRK
jgi:hypothetical protein